jgi:hypothetical protein
VAPESNIYGDSAYTDYTIEDDIKEADFIQMMIQRKSNSKRKVTACILGKNNSLIFKIRVVHAL